MPPRCDQDSAYGITIQHIQPGQPQQNAYIERYNRTVRHEWLDQYIIESIEEAWRILISEMLLQLPLWQKANSRV